MLEVLEVVVVVEASSTGRSRTQEVEVGYETGLTSDAGGSNQPILAQSLKFLQVHVIPCGIVN